MNFYQKLNESWRIHDSLLCVGLDPDLDKLPDSVKSNKFPIFQFNKSIIDATAQWCCAFKPQIAYYSAIGAETQLEKTIEYIKDNYPEMVVILDAKRGDIGSTADMYAKEAFIRYDADAVTVNPYMGGDTLQPFLDYTDRGVVVLCKTSNPGSGDIQDLDCQGERIYLKIASDAANKWNQNKNISLVVGATYPEIIRSVRRIVGNIPLLVPGIGTQGGDLKAVLDNGLTENKTGLIINVSRAVINASSGNDFAQAAANEAQRLSGEINFLRH